MNLRQPFDNAIAGKLEQLSPPDMEQSWQEMKRLLDEEDSRGAGGKRPPSGGWWKIGLVALVVISGSWWILRATNNQDRQLASSGKAVVPATEKTIPATNANNQPIAQNTTLASNKNNNPVIAAASQPGLIAAPNAAAAITPADNKNNSVNLHELPNTAPAKINQRNAQQDFSGKETSYTKSNKASIAGRMGKSGPDTYSPDGSDLQNADNSFVTKSGFGSKKGRTKNARSQNSPSAGKLGSFGALVDAAGDNNSTANNSAVVNAGWRAGWTNGIMPYANIAQADLSSAIREPENTNEWTTRELLNKETKLRVARAQRDQAAELAEKKEKKKLHLDFSNFFKPFSLHADVDPWWAAGLSLNSGVTVGAQNRYNYNVNAKSGVLLDYLPSPYLQFHLNNYVYLQTEINFLSPQYTPQLLAYRFTGELSGQPGYSVQQSNYIQKLYYFNWPFSLHYSPVSNLYFSAGLQFSSFQSGLLTRVSKEYLTASGADHPSNVTSTTLKFKDDSTAAKIKPNEWRWQVGAEYYINRFSVGMRYNQSLSKSINETISPTLPPTVNRNQSLFFFVRYNLFESKRKDNTGAANP